MHPLTPVFALFSLGGVALAVNANGGAIAFILPALLVGIAGGYSLSGSV